MAVNPFKKEELNFFKFASIVQDEFPKMLRQTFLTMWNNKIAPLPTFQVWDDTPAVRNLLLKSEGGKTDIPTNKSFNDWDCTALFKATIYSKTFSLPTTTKTLSQQYLKGKKPSPFHSTVISPTGNQDESLTLAIDQLRLLRNSLCHISETSISKTDFDQYVQFAKDAFAATGVSTDRIDYIGNLGEEDFPTEKVNELNQNSMAYLQDDNKFLQGKVVQGIFDQQEMNEKVVQSMRDLGESILQRLDKMDVGIKDQDSGKEFGQAAKGFAISALRTSLIYGKGGDLSFSISAESVRVVSELGITAVTLGGIYAAYKVIKPLVFEGAITRGFGGERDDQEVRDIKPGSLHVLLHCLTDERFLEVLEDYEYGRLKDSLHKEFLQIGIEIKGIKMKTINMEEINKTKEAINRRTKESNFETEIKSDDIVAATSLQSLTERTTPASPPSVDRPDGKAYRSMLNEYGQEMGAKIEYDEILGTDQTCEEFRSVVKILGKTFECVGSHHDSSAQPAQLARNNPKIQIRNEQMEIHPKLSLLQTSEASEVCSPRRPDRGGTLGRQIKLRVNFLPVSLPEIDIHHYHTEIIAKGRESGKGYTKREAPMIIGCMVDQYQKSNPHGPKLVYDKTGKNVYCKSAIPGIETNREYAVLFTTDNGKQREYTVKIKWVSKVSLYDLSEALKGNRTEIPYDTMQAIQVVFRHLPNMTSIPAGASFFNHPDGREKDLGFGVQVWNGTFISIRPTQWKMMMLNVDTCSSVFYKAQPVLKFLCEFFNLAKTPRHLNDHQIEDFNDEIKEVKIETTHLKRKQRVSGVSTESAKNEKFDCDGTKVSVFEYFKKKHNITLEYPDLPCLKLGQNGASTPMELCKIIEGQRYQSKLTKEQLQAMIKHTALPAPDRQQLINNLVRNAKFDKDEFLADFGIEVGHDMPRLTGRVLNPPMIAYGQSEKELPRNGAWNMQHKSYKTVDLKEWAIVSCENPRFLNNACLDKFINSLVQAGRDKGLSINPSPCFRNFIPGSERIGQLFEDLYHRYPNLQLLIIILPGQGNLDAYYEAVKYYGDIIYGIRTQVIKANTASRKATDRQTMANICLKINAKLGGTTSILDKSGRSEILSRPVIIFGADVTHPSPRDVNSRLIAAVVASMDSHPNLYSAEVRVQEHRKEIITELKDIVKILLKKFRAATRAQPEKIIFYRHGVSEGQFKDVLLHELRAIQLACYELHESFKPAITFIVVQKRRHTRFFAENPRDQCGKSKNIPPGTVVDTDVCHPYEFDWYLCSHAGIQGTSKPAHYHVLYDDSNFTSDQLQTLSNQLCHTYVRCARAVSIPAPAYYAHHVAFRARYHLAKLERGRTENALSLQEMLDAVKIHERLTNTMYFA